MKKVTCCYKCVDRVIGCHGICKQYIEETKVRAEEKKLEVQAKQTLADIGGIHAHHKRTNTKGLIKHSTLK